MQSDRMDEDDEGPTEVNTTKASHLVKVHRDKLTVTYNGKGNHNQDVGSVQANRPFSNRVMIGYFEVTIVSAGQRGCMAVGLANTDFDLRRQPGWEPWSYGYHGEDGRKFYNSSRGEPYGGKFTSDDVIGCGLHFRTREIFFTKNGKNLGVAFTEPGHAYYPTVGLHSQGETVTLNFGSRPFVFPLDEMLREEREKLRQTVSRVPLELSTVHHLVRDYLATEGLSESLKSFEAAAGLAELPDPSDDGSADDTMPEVQSNGTVDANGTNGAAEARSACSEVRQNGAREHTSQITSRSEIRTLILSGDTARAVDACEAAFPGLLATRPLAKAYLHCQEYIELVRAQRREEAVDFARRVLAPLLFPSAPQSAAEDGSEAHEYVHLVIGLLAYLDPESSPLAHLLAPAHRGKVADVVNTAILEVSGRSGKSVLQRLMEQLLVSHDTLRKLQGGRGEVLSLDAVMRNS